MVKLRFHRQEFQFPYSFSASLVRHLNIFTLGKRDINNAQIKKKYEKANRPSISALNLAVSQFAR